MEVILHSGDRLRIAAGVDAATHAAGAERVARSAMIHLPASVRVDLATTPSDMRRSFDGLHALVNAVP